MDRTRTPRSVVTARSVIGNHLRTWRLLQRLTIEQVADRSGVSRDTVIRLEKGTGVSLENLLRIARSLGVLDKLVTAVDPYESDVGRLRADEVLPERVRHRRSGQR